VETVIVSDRSPDAVVEERLWSDVLSADVLFICSRRLQCALKAELRRPDALMSCKRMFR
jgi:hypothetical protein